MRRYTGIMFSNAGVPQGGIPVGVSAAGTTDLAMLFAEDGITQIANPMVTDEAGQFSFKILSGVYDFLDINSEVILAEVQIFDFRNPGEWVGLWTFPNTGFRFGVDGNRTIYTAGEDQLGFDSGIRVGGTQTISPALMLIGSEANTDFIKAMKSLGATNPAFSINSAGEIVFGPDASAGGFTGSVKIYRSGTSQLTMNGGLVIDAPLFQHKGFALGFYNADPIIKPAIAPSGAVLDNINDAPLIALLNGLSKLGLISYAMIIAASGQASIVVNGTLSAVITRDSVAGAVIAATGIATIHAGVGDVSTVGGAAIGITATGTPTVV